MTSSAKMASGFWLWPIKTWNRSRLIPPIDESDLILRGYVAFLDPPKDSTAPAILALHAHGVSVKILTGDNELVSQKICREVKLDIDHVLLGTQIETMSDAELSEAVENTTLFVRLTPAHKQRIIRALQGRGHVVGFMGDGINDAPALHTADVGISVDSAVDIAKETADLILLEKSLMVLDQGVIEGRKIFANILKYIRMGASSSFGNMFSVVGASAFLPFVPMAPIQILTNNLLYDFSQVPIPADDVDPEQIAKPRPWSMPELYRFIVFIGPCSSIFDYTTFFMMLYLFNCWNPQRGPVSNRVVRRIDPYPNPDHSCYPDQQVPLPAEPGQLAGDRHHHGYYDDRHVVAHLAHRHRPGLQGPALPLLAPAGSDLDLLCLSDPRGEGLALA